MESITIYPKNEKQKSLVKSLLEELNVNFEIEKHDETQFSKEEYYAKIDHSIEQAEKGNSKILTKEDQSRLLGL